MINALDRKIISKIISTYYVYLIHLQVYIRLLQQAEFFNGE